MHTGGVLIKRLCSLDGYHLSPDRTGTIELGISVPWSPRNRGEHSTAVKAKGLGCPLIYRLLVLGEYYFGVDHFFDFIGRIANFS